MPLACSRRHFGGSEPMHRARQFSQLFLGCIFKERPAQMDMEKPPAWFHWSYLFLVNLAALYHCYSYSIIWDWVWLSTQSIQEKQRIRPRCWKASHTHTQTHTHTQGTKSNPQTELLNESQKCGLRPKLPYNIHDRIPLPLLISSEVLSCAQGADMSFDISEKFQLVPVRSPTSRCSDCKKVWKARATSAWHGIAGGVESPCWKTRCPWM